MIRARQGLWSVSVYGKIAVKIKITLQSRDTPLFKLLEGNVASGREVVEVHGVLVTLFLPL